MIRIDSSNYSEYTQGKQNELVKIISAHIKITTPWLDQDNVDNKYSHLDLTAGPGIYLGPEWHDNVPIVGSPIIALRAMRDAGIPYKSLLVEREHLHYSALKSAVADENLGTGTNIIWRNSRNITNWDEYIQPEPGKYVRGLIYSDAGGQPWPLDIMDRITKDPTYRHMDVLLRFSGTSYKRTRRAYPHIYDQKLPSLLESVNIRDWFITNPIGRSQWIFLFGTNRRCSLYSNYPMHSIKSAEGMKYINKVSLTIPEYYRATYDIEKAARDLDLTIPDIP